MNVMPQQQARILNRGQRGGRISPHIPVIVVGFLLGCITSGSLFLIFASGGKNDNTPTALLVGEELSPLSGGKGARASLLKYDPILNPLQGIRIFIAIAAYDFSQLPHLEEVIDAYQDLCVAGPIKVDVVIHATIAYPVTLIDLWNTRLNPTCKDIFSITIVLKEPSLRLHLVDCHRPMFYEKINDYDLFIYTEDDIRVTPRAVAAYLYETAKVRQIVGPSRASDFNVGIVRYEYNYPSNVIIDDKTRHATQNVTRVYWEHGQYPIFDKAVAAVPHSEFSETHVHMQNHHQGMFLATPELLLAWKERENCEFDKVKNRPGKRNNPSQPAEGTQRVWMSSQELYGGGHCNVQQVIPIDAFGTLTVFHLPNKNYRRVGHFRNRTFSDGTEKFEPSVGLLTAMRLHLEIRNQMPQHSKQPYWGIRMVDAVEKSDERTPFLERRMREYQAYVDRGGILSKDDMTTIDLEEKSGLDEPI